MESQRQWKSSSMIRSIGSKAHWWYVARRRIVFDWVFRTLRLCPDPPILDVGCGTGFNMRHLRTAGYDRVVGTDLSAHALSFCRSSHLPHLVRAEGTNPPHGDGIFDIVLALDLIEHLDHDLRALKEFARVLKADGALFVFAPAFGFLWGEQDRVSHHRRRYTAPELQRKSAAAGLVVQKLSYANTLLFPLIFAARLVLRLAGHRAGSIGENELHPRWSNRLLLSLFAAERSLLRYTDLPLGVSLLCIARKPR